MNVKLGSMKRLDVYSLNFDFCMEMQHTYMHVGWCIFICKHVTVDDV